MMKLTDTVLLSAKEEFDRGRLRATHEMRTHSQNKTPTSISVGVVARVATSNDDILQADGDLSAEEGAEIEAFNHRLGQVRTIFRSIFPPNRVPRSSHTSFLSGQSLNLGCSRQRQPKKRGCRRITSVEEQCVPNALRPFLR